MSRTNRSAIINVSSVGQTCPSPYTGDYSGSKRFLTLLSLHLHDNYFSKIDVQDLQPGYVTTNIARNYKGADAITAERCVESSLRDLGQEVSTIPVVIHSFMAQFMHFVYRFSMPLYKATVVKGCEKFALENFKKDYQSR